MLSLKAEVYVRGPDTHTDSMRRREPPVADGTPVASAVVELPIDARRVQLLAAVRAAFSLDDDDAATLPEFHRVGAGSTGEFSPAALKCA